MKFVWIRYASLFLVLCICLCLMCCLVFASSNNSFVLTFTYSYNDSVYYSNSDTSSVDFAIQSYNNKWPVSFTADGLGVLDFDPSDYHEIGPYLYFSPSYDSVQFGVDLDQYDIVASVPSGVKDYLNLPDVISVIFSFHVPESPSSGLLSDLQLTGTSFLETVQGIVLTIGKNPLLLLTVGIFFVGGCFAIFSRLLSKN